MNHLDKHAAVLEGVETISRCLLWSCTAEKTFLPLAGETSAQLEHCFLQLYKNMLLFLAYTQRFLSRNSKSQ